VDATGAGDAFCGGFSFGFMIHNWSLQKSLTFANACAALKLTQLGARTGMPNLMQVHKFLTSHGFPDFLTA
jgi:sugar/nucleoside kinase (ribokinase family)